MTTDDFDTTDSLTPEDLIEDTPPHGAAPAPLEEMSEDERAERDRDMGVSEDDPATEHMDGSAAHYVEQQLRPALASLYRSQRNLRIAGSLAAIAGIGLGYSAWNAHGQIDELHDDIAAVTSDLKAEKEANAKLTARLDQYETPAQMATRLYGSAGIKDKKTFEAYLNSVIGRTNDARVRKLALEQSTAAVNTNMRLAFGLGPREAITMDNVMAKIVAHDKFDEALPSEYSDREAEAAVRDYLATEPGKRWFSTYLGAARLDPAKAETRMSTLLGELGRRIKALEDRRPARRTGERRPVSEPRDDDDIKPPGSPRTPYDRSDW